MSMVSEKEQALWIGIPGEQGLSETDWVEYQPSITATLKPITKRAGTNNTTLVCWADELPDNSNLAIRQNGTVFQGKANVLSTNEVLTSVDYGLGSATYDSTFVDVSPEDRFPRSVSFKPDGTKMYLNGWGNNFIHQYTLSTAWDVGTASYDNVRFSVGSQDLSNQSIVFGNNGSTLYMVGSGSDRIYQYNLSIAWDLLSISYSGLSFSITHIAGGGTSPNSIDANQDGSKLYVAANNNIYQYNLSTPWNLSSASYSGTSVYVADEGNPSGMHFTSDGLKLYTISGTTVFLYSLSSAWDIGTATYTGFSFTTTNNDVMDVAVSDDDSKMYTVSYGNDAVYQYSLPADVDNFRTEHSVDISNFQLSSTPQYVFNGLPEMKVCLEQSELRCVSRDLDLGLESVGTDRINVTYNDVLDQIINAGDTVVIDSNEVEITSIVISGETAGGDTIWGIDLPLTGTTPTFAYIKDRSDLMPYSRTLVIGDVYEYTVSLSSSGAMDHTFSSVDKREAPGRAIQLSAIGDEGTSVSNLTVNLWKT